MPVTRKQLIFFIQEFWYFGIRQAWSCLFGGAMLAGILVTKFLWQADFPIYRYDFLVIYAIALQALLVILKLESWEEVKVIFVFHVIGTAMELFKTHVGSWSYPEASYLKIGAVPLFSGFMYSAVGSYLARVWRIFAFRFEHFPSQWAMITLCALIYINFFTHHYLPDMRYLLFAATGFLFWRTRVYYKPRHNYYWMPLLLGFLLVSLFIWFAENIGTLGATWIYPAQQAGWHMVSFSKMGSWFLLMIISFVLVSLLHREKSHRSE